MMRPQRPILGLSVVVLVCATSTYGQGPGRQTDWSGGPGTFGPVSDWGARFLGADRVAWRSIRGQLALSSMPRSTPLGAVVAEDAGIPSSCSVGDIDGDGRADVISTDAVYDIYDDLGAVYWWKWPGEDPWIQYTVSDDFYGARYTRTADLDRDGDMDVLAAAYYGVDSISPEGWRNGRFAWFENLNGDGSAWTQHLVGELYWGAQHIDCGDFDGDGDIDLVGACELTDGVWEQEGDVVWFENVDGAGIEWEAHDLELEINAFEAHAVDLDLDGDLDVVSTHYERIIWFENAAGDGSVWNKRHVTASLIGAVYIDVGDIDNDGDVDIIGGAYNTSQIAWWENTAGSGTVWFPRYVATGSGGRMLEARDVDGDGDLDALLTRVAGSSSEQAWWIENVSGDGLVWNPLFIGGFDSHTSLASGDVDADGKLDVAVSDEGIWSGAPHLTWYDLTEFVTEGDLLSSVLDGGNDPGWSTLRWDADVGGDAGLVVEVRAGDDPFDLGPFVPVEQSGQSLTDLIDAHAQYFQYRLVLSGVSGVSPVIREIEIQTGVPGDLDGDGCVGLSDLAILLAEYGCTAGCTADLDGDDDVDLGDLAFLLAVYEGDCP